MAAVFAQTELRPQPPRRDSSARSERAERRNSQGLQASSLPPAAASPVLTQNTHTSHYQPPRTSQIQGIESQLAMSLEIPPYNPSKRNSGQKQATAPSTPSSSYSNPAHAYPSPASIPRPGTSSSTRSNSSTGSGNQSSRQQHRPASATVVPMQTPEQYASSQRSAATTGARPKDRNSHQVNAPHTHANPELNQGMGIYQPPPNTNNGGRPKIFFGPYQLLQTLGEGEFGKVKLGVRGDTRWGEEVAIKLIKRGSVEESAARMTKVNREIDVLRIVKHPNIVRLHDVIQTERYIGIVLEYASGGELFDHILAHRYLKDRDASKLFAQLISGVAYLHAKKIIHRDLKLENLLLDRNRNIIITDFGFANRFEEKGNDLMATSCGSPCYAAPELVVQDGKYVGSAVDVWSCGVILYAMLAGYLPFDDDPLNPDSENINLLYKYIINTPLSFPEWITPEPRDLLQKMLVPDPSKRCSLQDVAQHRWLRKYASLFDRTVEDLEGLAADQDDIKRQMLERQRDAVLYQEQAAQMTRSQTTAGMRPQSAMVTSSSMQAPFAPSASASVSGRPGPSTTSNRRAHAYSAVVVPTVAAQPEPLPAADPFAMSPSQSHSAIPMSVSVSAPPRAENEEEQYQAYLALQQDRKRIPSGEQEMPKAKSQRTDTPDEAEERERERKSKAKANRYTVQVEYVPEQAPVREQKVPKDAIMEQPVQVSPLPLEEKAQPVQEEAKLNELPEPIATVIEEPTPAESSASLVPSISVAEDHSPTTDSAAQSECGPPESATSSAHADLGHSSANLPSQPSTTALPGKTTTPPASPKAEEKRADKPVPFPPSPEQKRSKPLTAPAANEQVQRTASNSSRPPSSAASVSSKHRKAGSSDRFSISRFLGGSTTSLDKQAKRGPLESSAAAPQKEPFYDATNKRKGSRRKAFSLVVEPFKPASSGASVRSGKRSSVRMQESSSGSTSSRPMTADRPRTRSSVALETTPAQGAVMSPPPRNLAPSISSTRREPSSASTAISTDPSWVASGPPAGKAKRVMDWFRWKSMPRDSGLASSQGPAAISTDFDRNTNQSASSRVTRASVKRQENLQHDQPAPSLVVTQTPADELSGVEVNASPSTITSQNSAAPAPKAPTPVAQESGPLIPVTDVQRAASIASNRTGSLEPFTEARLRFHQGAVDQNALTYRHPPAVLVDIRKILWAMGIDVREEAGPFRLKCTRRSSKKVAATHGVSVNAVTSGSLASSLGPGSMSNATSIGPASSERLDGRTGLPASPHTGMTSSPSSTFKAFFGRRSSTNSVHTQAGMPSPALSTSTAMESPDLLLSPPSSSSATMGASTSAPLPYYGKTDSGAEVRFTVELSRMKNLPKLYAVDVRRLKGELWAYRGIYNAILERLELAE